MIRIFTKLNYIKESTKQTEPTSHITMCPLKGRDVDVMQQNTFDKPNALITGTGVFLFTLNSFIMCIGK